MSIPSSLAVPDAASIISSTQAYDDESLTGVDALQVEKRYGEDRAKRLRDDGIEQFVDISLSDKFRHFQDDPWVDIAAAKDAQTMFPDNRCQMLILGAGFGGLLYAVRMIEGGVRPEDIRIVDSAGGFGEIRNYANVIAEKWKITSSAVFQTTAEKLVWDEGKKKWQAELVQRRKGEPPQMLNIHSPFVATVNGVLNWPQLPGVPGILDYQGEIFHSSRWNYSITGGSPADPSLEKLKNKRVAIIGTGASAVQAVLHLARWSKHLYVVQRTPAFVDRRYQRETDPEWFHKGVTTSTDWQRERHRNFHQHFTTAKQPAVNLVDNQWTHAVGLVPLSGNPDPAGPKSMEDLPAYMKRLHAIDLPQQTQIRERVADEVFDTSVAEKLQSWYPSWCKRPCFHDEYLPAFNRDNVTLVDTDGKGLDSIIADSIVVGNQSYPVDVIIFATGFRGPFGGTPAEKANLTITGRGGLSVSHEWAHNGPTTLHGVLDHNFPNLFLSGPCHASNSPNFLFNIDALAKHSAYILAEAKRRAGGQPFTVASTAAAVEDWGMQIMVRSIPMAAISGCTPSYFNLEGGLDRVPPEEQMKMARSGLWGHGIEDFLKHIEAWRAEGSMQGIEVQT